MRVLDVLNRRAVGFGLAVAIAMIAIGLLIVGSSPSDAEMNLVLWPATLVGGAVVLTVVHRDYRASGNDPKR